MSSSGLNEDIAQQEGEASLPNGEVIANIEDHQDGKQEAFVANSGAVAGSNPSGYNPSGVNTRGFQAIPYYAGNAAQLQLERSYS